MCPALPVVAIAYLGITVGNRRVFTAVDQAGLFCKPTKNLESVPDAGALVSFETSNICCATGYKVARLERYYVWTNPDRQPCQAVQGLCDQQGHLQSHRGDHTLDCSERWR